MSIEYLKNYNNDDLEVPRGYISEPILTLTNMPVDDISADAFAFDIGVSGQTAIVSGACSIISAVGIQKIKFTIPANAFTKAQKKLVLQIRWTISGGSEKIIVRRFIDVINPVTPTP